MHIRLKTNDIARSIKYHQVYAHLQDPLLMAKKKRFEPFLSVHFDAPSLFFALWSCRVVQVLSGSKQRGSMDNVPSDLAHVIWYERPANVNRYFGMLSYRWLFVGLIPKPVCDACDRNCGHTK